MSYLRYLCLLGHSGVHHILCSVYVLFVLILCTLLPVSLDCLFLIVASVCSSVYLSSECDESHQYQQNEH
jgi:hypothetical protein